MDEVDSRNNSNSSSELWKEVLLYGIEEYEGERERESWCSADFPIGCDKRVHFAIDTDCDSLLLLYERGIDKDRVWRSLRCGFVAWIWCVEEGNSEKASEWNLLVGDEVSSNTWNARRQLSECLDHEKAKEVVHAAYKELTTLCLNHDEKLRLFNLRLEAERACVTLTEVLKGFVLVKEEESCKYKDSEAADKEILSLLDKARDELLQTWCYNMFEERGSRRNRKCLHAVELKKRLSGQLFVNSLLLQGIREKSSIRIRSERVGKVLESIICRDRDNGEVEKEIKELLLSIDSGGRDESGLLIECLCFNGYFKRICWS